MKDYEKQIAKTLLKHAGLDTLIDVIVNTSDEDYEYTGHGYYLTIKNPSLPTERHVLNAPQISGRSKNVEEVGFLAFLESNEFTLECHGYVEGIPEDFRERQIEIIVHT